MVPAREPSRNLLRSPVPRYKLTIEYDGTDFCGWQKQEPFAPADSAGADDHLSIHPGTDAFNAAETLATREGETRSRVALRTVQHVVEKAVREVVREPVVLLGASRTDSGVHARGQVAAFTCSGDEILEPGGSEEGGGPSSSPSPRGLGWPLSRGADRLLRAINGRLPDDVQITAIEPTTPHFNPIGGATSKSYSYTLSVAPHPPLGLGLRPLWDRRYVHRVWGELDLETMNAAAQRLIGEHDFAAFAAANHGRLTTVRTIFTCSVTDVTPFALTEVRAQGRASAGSHNPAATRPLPGTLPTPGLAREPLKDGDRRLRIEVSGSGFLYNMVRIIAGTLVEAGRGKLTPEAVTAALQSKDRRNAGPTLPPTGLCLEWIRY